MKKLIPILIVLISWIMLASCDSDANVASRNLSKAADQFEIDRRVIFYNWITWDYMLSIEWKCSLWNYDTAKTLTVTCKLWNNEFKKHFLWLSDNVTYFVEQLESKDVSVNHYRVIFKPQVIIPDIDFVWSLTDIPKND